MLKSASFIWQGSNRCGRSENRLTFIATGAFPTKSLKEAGRSAGFRFAINVFIKCAHLIFCQSQAVALLELAGVLQLGDPVQVDRAVELLQSRVGVDLQRFLVQQEVELVLVVQGQESGLLRELLGQEGQVRVVFLSELVL